MLPHMDTLHTESDHFMLPHMYTLHTESDYFMLPHTVLLLELIFLLLYVWVRVTSCFPVQLVILVSFLKVSSH